MLWIYRTRKNCHVMLWMYNCDESPICP